MKFTIRKREHPNGRKYWIVMRGDYRSGQMSEQDIIERLKAERERSRQWEDVKQDILFSDAIAEIETLRGQELNLPVLRTPEDGIIKTLEQWCDFSRRDDCLARMVPSDLRLILTNLSEPEQS